MFNSKNLEIPKKSTFTIEEVAGLLDVKPYVVKFWASEFDVIKTITSINGNKLFEREEIDNIIKVRELLIEDKLTIEKAKAELYKSLKHDDDQMNISEEESAEKDLIDPETDAKLQKIIIAKSKLRSLISSIDHIKQRLN